MSEKPQNPWVVAGLSVAAIAALAIAWSTYRDITQPSRDTNEAIERIREAGKN